MAKSNPINELREYRGGADAWDEGLAGLIITTEFFSEVLGPVALQLQGGQLIYGPIDPANPTITIVAGMLVQAGPGDLLLDLLAGEFVMEGIVPVPMGLTGTLPDATEGVPYSEVLTLTGDYIGPVTWDISAGALPTGFDVINASTGYVTDSSPTTQAAAGFTVRATDSTPGTPQVATSVQSIEVEASVTPVTIGQTGVGGTGNWPTSSDRALLSKAVVAATTTLTQMNLRTTSANAAGELFKGLMYAADGIGGNPGTLLAQTVPSSATPAGAQLVTMAVVGTPIIAPQNVWIGYVADGAAGGAGGETESGAAGVAGDTIMLNSGETNFASPSNPAGNWPGSPGPYANIGAFWWDGNA